MESYILLYSIRRSSHAVYNYLQHFSYLTMTSQLLMRFFLKVSMNSLDVIQEFCCFILLGFGWFGYFFFCFGFFVVVVCFRKKPCPSAILLGLSPHPFLPHSICLLYPFLTLAPFALLPLLFFCYFNFFLVPICYI